MLFTLAGPLFLSFEKNVAYSKKWKYLPVPFLITTIYFVIWDSIFTKYGIWSFNDKYILGYKIFLLPIEEWMFFIFVPFACLFIYESANYHIKKDYLQKYAYHINAVILVAIKFYFCSSFNDLCAVYSETTLAGQVLYRLLFFVNTFFSYQWHSDLLAGC